MNRPILMLLRTTFSVLVVGLLFCSSEWPQGAVSEREGVLAALSLSYGAPSPSKKLFFAVTPNYVLTPNFSSDGLLIEISLEPKSNTPEPHPQRDAWLTHAEFESILANINSIKPLGALEEEFPAKFVHGGRAWGKLRHQNAYLETAELISYGPPRPIAFAYIYYLHPVTGIAKLPRFSKPEEASSFGLVCVGGEPYIAPKDEVLKLLLSRPNERQTVELAGPTRGDCGQLR